MNTSDPTPNEPAGEATSEVDLLISRAVDGVASRPEWVLLESAAHADADVWRQLALSYKHQHALEREVRQAGERAEMLELSTVEQPVAGRIGFATWGGWFAAAAAVVLALVLRTPQPMSSPTQQAAGFAPITSAQEALNLYLDRGSQEGLVLGQAPRQVIEATPASDGRGYVVLCVRPIYERVRLDDLYQFSSDEAGLRHIVPVRLAPVTRTNQGTKDPV